MTIVVSKTLKPGQKPKPDFQGNADTCTSHALGKALTGGLHFGKFNITLDISQNEAVNAIINKNQHVGGCWPDELQKKSILVYDRKTNMYFNAELHVAECDFKQLQQNWDNATYVAVYKNSGGLHCIYVNKIHGGKLCCMNSYGKRDQFPQLKPGEVKALYEVTAKIMKAPKSNQPSPITSRKSTQLVSHSTIQDQEKVKLEKALELEKEKNKTLELEREMLEKMVKQNETNKQNKKFVIQAPGWMKKCGSYFSAKINQVKDKLGN